MADGVSLDIHRLLAMLPQRYPFVLVDRVTEVKPGSSIKGHKSVSYNEPFMVGHFPERPMMPGMLVLESLAQIGTVLVHATEPFDPTTNLLFVLEIERARFRRTVIPGDQLDLSVKIVDHRSNIWKLRGHASVEGTLGAQAEWLASLVDRQV